MTAVLPAGLLSSTAAAVHLVDEPLAQLTNTQVLRKLWKVHAIQSDVTADQSSTRARNLFWRVWSSPALTESITSARLMRLWRRCGQEYDLAPIADHIAVACAAVSPDATCAAPTRARSSSVSPSGDTYAIGGLSPGDGQDGGQSAQPSPCAPGPRASPAPAPLAPHVPSNETTQLPSDDTSGSTSNTTSDTSSCRPSLGRAIGGTRTRPPVLPHTGKARTRPQLPRRKSSTPRSPATANAPRSPKSQPEVLRMTPRVDQGAEDGSGTGHAPTRPTRPPPAFPLVSALSERSAFNLPTASSWQSVDSAPADHPPLATTAPAGTSEELVDPDFRGKFAEQQLRASSTNLAGLGRMHKTGSVVRFADQIPEDLRKGKQKEGFGPPPAENIGPSRLRTSFSMDAVADSDGDGDDDDDDDDDDAAVASSGSEGLGLPRTKSQLSLLIKHRREETGTRDIGPPAALPDADDKKMAQTTEKRRSKEEELLSMGRRDGVTKAGGVQVPKEQRVRGHEDAGYLSPASPDRIF